MDVFFCGTSVAGGTLEYVLPLRYFLMFNVLTCQCSMTFLWLQRYYMSARSSSPVYGVAFDPCQLFAVLDQSLHVLDFSVFRDTPGIRNPQYTLGWMPWWCWVLLGQFHRCYFFVQFLSPGAMWCTHSACRMYSVCNGGECRVHLFLFRPTCGSYTDTLGFSWDSNSSLCVSILQLCDGVMSLWRANWATYHSPRGQWTD